MEAHEVKILEDIKQQHPAIADQLDEVDTLGEAMVTLSSHLSKLEREASMKTEKRVLLSAQVPESLKTRMDEYCEEVKVTKRVVMIDVITFFLDLEERMRRNNEHPLTPEQVIRNF